MSPAITWEQEEDIDGESPTESVITAFSGGHQNHDNQTEEKVVVKMQVMTRAKVNDSLNIKQVVRRAISGSRKKACLNMPNIRRAWAVL